MGLNSVSIKLMTMVDLAFILDEESKQMEDPICSWPHGSPSTGDDLTDGLVIA